MDRLLNVPRLMKLIKTSYPKRLRARLKGWNRHTLAIAQARAFRSKIR